MSTGNKFLDGLLEDRKHCPICGRESITWWADRQDYGGRAMGLKCSEGCGEITMVGALDEIRRQRMEIERWKAMSDTSGGLDVPDDLASHIEPENTGEVGSCIGDVEITGGPNKGKTKPIEFFRSDNDDWGWILNGSVVVTLNDVQQSLASWEDLAQVLGQDLVDQMRSEGVQLDNPMSDPIDWLLYKARK